MRKTFFYQTAQNIWHVPKGSKQDYISKIVLEKNHWPNSTNSPKVIEYDQETPQSHTADNSRHHEEEPQNIYSNKYICKTMIAKQPAFSSSSRWLQN